MRNKANDSYPVEGQNMCNKLKLWVWENKINKINGKGKKSFHKWPKKIDLFFSQETVYIFDIYAIGKSWMFLDAKFNSNLNHFNKALEFW